MSKQQFTVPCGCAGTCTIALVTEFEQYKDDPQEFFITFYTVETRPTWRWRLSRAWKVLRGEDAWQHELCPDVADMRRLAMFIRKQAGDV